jgi:hypothetical protein
VFVVWRKTKQFCEARFVGLAHGTLAIGLDPFGMLPEQGLVHLLLKLKVRLDFDRHHWRSTRLHVQDRRRQAPRRDCACVGFSIATREVSRPTSIEVERWHSGETQIRSAGSDPSATIEDPSRDGRGLFLFDRHFGCLNYRKNSIAFSEIHPLYRTGCNNRRYGSSHSFNHSL